MKLFKRITDTPEKPVKEPLKESKKVSFTTEESVWLAIRAKEECTSENSIIRKSVKYYREFVGKSV